MEDNPEPVNPVELVERLLTTKNYREIDPTFIEQIVKRAMKPNRSEKEILSQAKTKIQNATNRFRVGGVNYRGLISELGDDPLHEMEKIDRQLFCADWLRQHEASKDRIPFIRRYYEEIFAALPPIRSVIDLGCGLNPVALSFMHLPKDVAYSAFDLPMDLIDFLNEFFHFIGINGHAFQSNLHNGMPDVDGDLTFIQKTIPVLEKTRKGSGRALFDAIRTPYAVVSFVASKEPKKEHPKKDKSGKIREPKIRYDLVYDAIIAASDWQSTKLTYPNEVVYVLKRD